MNEPWRDVQHTGPGTLAGRYMRRFWQPVCRSQDLAPGKAKPIEIMSEQFTLYRGEAGDPHVVAFRCAHRGTQLSTGWVEGDSIRCRYHGWKYNGSGQCVEQPGESDSFASTVKIRSYPTQDYIGLVFVYFGDEKVPPIRRHPDFEGPGILDLEEPEYWPCNYFNRVDNACDMSHVLYTHYESQKRQNGTAPPRNAEYYRHCVSEETPYGIRSANPGGQPGGKQLYFFMPNANQDDDRGALQRRGILNASKSSSATRIRWRVPVNDEMNVTFSVTKLKLTTEEEELYRKTREKYEAFLQQHSSNAVADSILGGKMTIEEVDQAATRANMFSIEDYVAQVGQGPTGQRGEERLGKIDGGVLLLRKIWQRELKALAEGKPLKQWGSKE